MTDYLDDRWYTFWIWLWRKWRYKWGSDWLLTKANRAYVKAKKRYLKAKKEATE